MDGVESQRRTVAQAASLSMGTATEEAPVPPHAAAPVPSLSPVPAKVHPCPSLRPRVGLRPRPPLPHLPQQPSQPPPRHLWCVPWVGWKRRERFFSVSVASYHGLARLLWKREEGLPLMLHPKSKWHFGCSCAHVSVCPSGTPRRCDPLPRTPQSAVPRECTASALWEPSAAQSRFAKVQCHLAVVPHGPRP